MPGNMAIATLTMKMANEEQLAKCEALDKLFQRSISINEFILYIKGLDLSRC